jgi:hypothetical protein
MVSLLWARFWVWAEVLDLSKYTQFLATFGYYLASFLASVYLLVSQKEMNIWPSIRTTNKKQIHKQKMVIL